MTGISVVPDLQVQAVAAVNRAISGQVLLAGGAPGVVLVRLLNALDGAPLSSVWTDATGNFTFKYGPIGSATFTLLAHKTGETRAATADGVAQPSSGVEMEFVPNGNYPPIPVGSRLLVITNGKIKAITPA